MNSFIKTWLTATLALSVFTTQAQVVNDKGVYKVKKKDTVFGIAKQFNISITELLDANPAMKQAGYELQAGSYLIVPKIPTRTTGQTTQTTSPKGTTPVRKNVKVGVLLPLHDKNGDGRRMVEYYRGLLMACDSLRRSGLSTEIQVKNVEEDTDIRQVLLDENLRQCNLIIGPLYTTQVAPLATFCRTYGIKLIIPFSIEGDDVVKQPHLFQVYQSPDRLNMRAIETFVNLFKKSHVVFIDCNDPNSNKYPFTAGLRNELENNGVKYNITNLKSSEEQFAKAFHRNKPNIVVLNTGRSPELTVALEKLNGLAITNPKLTIKLFGYNEWLMYGHNLNNFHRFDTYIPSTYYYNALGSDTKNIEREYTGWFHNVMQNALPRFALTGFDHGMFFLKGWATYGDKFMGNSIQNNGRYLQTPLTFKQAAPGGGYINNTFMLIHYMPDNRTETLLYR